MDRLLNDRTIVKLRHHGVTCRIGDFIGSGGQGEVYRVQVNGGDLVQTLALKWYHPQWATSGHRIALEALTDREQPDRRFLWPIDIATSPSVPGFGYLMPIRPDRYAPCVDLVSCRTQIAFRELVLACLQLADCFLALHARGLCYRDINFGNVFVDPGTGAVLIADNDNVAIEGHATVGIRGTNWFMAPEVVRGEALPSVTTDLYSLSVLLFYLLMVHHPLEGVRVADGGVLGREEAAQVYGYRPLFIFDPLDHSNAPSPIAQRNPLIFWPLYPQMLRDLFTQAFTAGLRDPDERVRESQWRDCLSRVVDLMTRCGCGVDVFLEPDGRRAAPCWSCRSSARIDTIPPLILDPDREAHVVMLHPGKRLFAHHAGTQRFNYRQPVAEVVAHPELPGVYGLRNLSGAAWRVQPEDLPEIAVPPGRSFAIAPGTRVRFAATGGTFGHAATGMA